MEWKNKLSVLLVSKTDNLLLVNQTNHYTFLFSFLKLKLVVTRADILLWSYFLDKFKSSLDNYQLCELYTPMRTLRRYFWGNCTHTYFVRNAYLQDPSALELLSWLDIQMVPNLLLGVLSTSGGDWPSLMLIEECWTRMVPGILSPMWPGW